MRWPPLQRKQRRPVGMNILVTGSSGWLGQTLVPRLRRAGHRSSASIPCRARPPHRRLGRRPRAGAHGDPRASHRGHRPCRGALHKPHVATPRHSEFVAVNVQGTLNLLEEAVAPGSTVDRFVFTSTTSLMISQEIRDGTSRRRRARRLDRRGAVAARAAQHLRRHQALRRASLPPVPPAHGLPIVILRTARFFPEEDDMAHAIVQSGANTKANEFLFRRLTVEDAAEAHVVALDRAPEIGFDTFIVSAPDAVLAGRLRAADRGRALGGGPLLPATIPRSMPAAAGRCSTHRPRLRRGQGGAASGVRVQDGIGEFAAPPPPPPPRAARNERGASS